MNHAFLGKNGSHAYSCRVHGLGPAHHWLVDFFSYFGFAGDRPVSVKRYSVFQMGSAQPSHQRVYSVFKTSASNRKNGNGDQQCGGVTW